MTFRTLLLVLALASAPLSAAAQGGSASGEELETEARARFALGELYYSQARFAEAAAEFEAAYALHPHPLLLHNVYLARRDLGDIPGAVDALTRYLASATDLSASERRLLEGRLAAMQRQLETREPGDTTGEGTAPIEELGPTESVAGLGGEEGLEEETEEEVETPPPPARDEGPILGAIASFSVAGAGLLTAVITGPLAWTERDGLASRCAPSCTDADVSTARSLGITTDVALGISAAAAVAGAVLAAVSATSTPSGDVVVTPSVSTEHAGLVVGGSF